jgi:glycerophosphoryl diester phosphodiesterase
MSDTAFNLNILVAHRGLQSRFPENTLLALKKAIDTGAQYIELDIQYSDDCLPIIYHDPDLQRVSGIQGNVWDYPRKELLGISAYEPQRLGNRFKTETIPPLEALVALLKENPKVTAFVELKEESIAHCGRDLMLERVMNILAPVKPQVVLISYDYCLVEAARKAQWGQVGVVLKQWQDLETDTVRNIAADYIFVDHEKIPQQITGFDAIKGILVAYEVGDIALGKELINKGVSMLETFELERLS